jgi:hypothetical protein
VGEVSGGSGQNRSQVRTAKPFLPVEPILTETDEIHASPARSDDRDCFKNVAPAVRLAPSSKSSAPSVQRTEGREDDEAEQAGAQVSEYERRQHVDA